MNPPTTNELFLLAYKELEGEIRFQKDFLGGIEPAWNDGSWVRDTERPHIAALLEKKLNPARISNGGLYPDERWAQFILWFTRACERDNKSPFHDNLHQRFEAYFRVTKPEMFK